MLASSPCLLMIITSGYIPDGGSTMSISFVLAIVALILAVVSGTTGKAPLWIAVALLALALIIPGIPMK